MPKTIKELIATLPQQGTVTWIGVRPSHRAPMVGVDEIEASPESGLKGDRYSKRDGSRQVTIVQAEHLSVVGSVLDRDPIAPEMLRRNIVVKGINLLALKNREISIGSVVLKVTGQCHPCSKMEVALGAGGYNATRGHGGITASVVSAGRITTGDAVSVVDL